MCAGLWPDAVADEFAILAVVGRFYAKVEKVVMRL